MKRRVVVTGMGAVTPIGNTVEEFWNGIKTGKVGIGPITDVYKRQIIHISLLRSAVIRIFRFTELSRRTCADD